MLPNRREIDPLDQFLARLIRGKSTYPGCSDFRSHLSPDAALCFHVKIEGDTLNGDSSDLRYFSASIIEDLRNGQRARLYLIFDMRKINSIIVNIQRVACDQIRGGSKTRADVGSLSAIALVDTNSHTEIIGYSMVLRNSCRVVAPEHIFNNRSVH